MGVVCRPLWRNTMQLSRVTARCMHTTAEAASRMLCVPGGTLPLASARKKPLSPVASDGFCLRPEPPGTNEFPRWIRTSYILLPLSPTKKKKASRVLIPATSLDTCPDSSFGVGCTLALDSGLADRPASRGYRMHPCAEYEYCPCFGGEPWINFVRFWEEITRSTSTRTPGIKG